MAEKIVTFREIEHKRYLKDVFTVLFVVACGMPLAQGLFALPVTWMFGQIETMTPFLCALKTVVGLLYRGIGMLLPFLLFRMIRFRTPGRYFTRASEKTAWTSVLFTSLASVGLAGGVFLLSCRWQESLTEAGYVFTEPWTPSLLENDPVTSAVFIAAVALIPTLFYEIAFRGIVSNAVSDDHLGFAVVIGAMMCAGSFVSFCITPALFVSALVCGYGYAKTKSRLVSCLACALTGATVAALYLYEKTLENYVIVLFLAVGLTAGVIGFMLMSRRKAVNRLSAKDGAKAFFGSFAMWIYVLLILFVFLVFAIAKPKPKTEDGSPVSSDAAELDNVCEMCHTIDTFAK